MKMKKEESVEQNPEGDKRVIKRKVIELKNHKKQIYKGKALKYNNSFEVKDFEATI
jgi:hypothetical protein